MLVMQTLGSYQYCIYTAILQVRYYTDIKQECMQFHILYAVLAFIPRFGEPTALATKTQPPCMQTSHALQL